MTHEKKANDEHQDGPEYDQTLPPATDVPVHDDPEDSDAEPLGDTSDESD
jgi:hypothetical protein